MTFGNYSLADFADELREDARPYIPPCDTCGKPTERGDFGSCRHWCCADCAQVAYPYGCLACLREAVARDGYAVVRTRQGIASWWSAACVYPTCVTTCAHEHWIDLHTVVVERLEAA